MQTEKWGPNAWETLHFISFGYPENPDQNKKDGLLNFLYGFSKVMPCELCVKSYCFFLENLDIKKYYDSRDGVIFWVFVLHNLVNHKLGKKKIELEKVIYKYENMRSRCGNKNKPEYIECVKNLKEFSKEESRKKAIVITEKYNDLTKEILNVLLDKWMKY